jgi:hypothetical protein
MKPADLPVRAIVSGAGHGRYWFRLDAGQIFWDAEDLPDQPEGLTEQQLICMAEVAGFALASEKRLPENRAVLRILLPPEMSLEESGRLRAQIEQAITAGFTRARTGA